MLDGPFFGNRSISIYIKIFKEITPKFTVCYTPSTFYSRAIRGFRFISWPQGSSPLQSANFWRIYLFEYENFILRLLSIRLNVKILASVSRHIHRLLKD